MTHNSTITHAYIPGKNQDDPLCGSTEAARALARDPTASVVMPQEVNCRACRYAVAVGSSRTHRDPVQCGRTFPHLCHETTAGNCPGLRPDAVHAALITISDALRGGAGVLRVPDASADYDPPPMAADAQGRTRDLDDPWAESPSYAALEAGLRVIAESAAGGCEHSTSGIGSCFRNHRTADAHYAADRACTACIAWQVLRGLPLPVEETTRVTSEPETRLSFCDDGVLLECTRSECLQMVDGHPFWFQKVLEGWVTPESAMAARDAHVATHGGV